MRTTVDIDDKLLAKLRQKAAREGRRLSGLINDLVRETLARQEHAEKPSPKKDIVTYGQGGLRPGVHLDSMSDLLDKMEDRS